jgi:uncharacterized damage-inducible protein DinB
MTPEHVARLFRWDAWANRETLSSLRAGSRPPERALQVMAHVLGASWLWLARLEDEASPLAVWPALPLSALDEKLDSLNVAWGGYLPRVTRSSLARTISYTNSKGERWTSREEDILLHVVFHGEHHRGQVATLLRDVGETPAYTDFIHAVRQGFVV